MRLAFLCGGSVLAVAASLCAAQAFAADATAGATAAATDNSPSVGELVVVASRREEKIQSVPMAITAFSAKQRALVGIQTVQDLTDYVPSLSYTSVSNRPYIRGLGRNTDNLSTASAVATYYNNIYYSANASTLLQKDDLFIGNIEVDNGPQILHGGNADGGEINYVSNMPTDHYYAEIRGGAGNYGDYFTEGVVSGPITDNIKFRLGANYTDMQGGYFHNLEGLGDQGGNLPNGSSGTTKYFEAQLQGKFDHLDMWGMISAGDFATNYKTTAASGNIPDTTLIAAAPFVPSGFFGLCGLPGVAGSANGAGCSSPANGGQTVVPGSVITDAVTANQFPGNNPGNVNLRNFIEEFSSTNYQNDNIAAATNVTYHLPGMDITYLGGFQSFDYELNYTNGTDAGVRQYQIAGPPGFGNLTIDPTPDLTYFAEKDHFWSHELDFTSTWDSPFQYLAGLYWYHEAYFQPVAAGVEPNQPQMHSPEEPCAAGLCAAPVNPYDAYSTSLTDLTYNSYAAFWSGNYKFNDQWKVSGSVRYTSDQKEGVQQWRFTEFDAIPGLTAAQLGAFTPNLDVTSAAVATEMAHAYPGATRTTINAATGFAQRTLDATWDAITGDANIDWTPDASTLVYGRYARGYKSGGFATYTIATNPETAPEYVDSFELGAKKSIGNNITLHGAGYYYLYDDDQVPLTVAGAGGLLTPEIANLPSVHVAGLELSGQWRPIDPLTLSLSYSYEYSSIENAGGCIENTADPLAQLPGAKTNGCAAANVNDATTLAVAQNIKGNPLPEAPPNKITANGLYTFTLPTGKLTLSGTAIWKDTTYAAVFASPEYKQNPYSQFNVRATYASADGHYNIILFCDNLFNSNGFDAAIPLLMNQPTSLTTKEDILYGYNLTAPRTFGIQLQYRWQ